MTMLLQMNGWNAISRLFEVMIPIGICVVLPIIIIALVLRARRHEVDKKTELMMKAVENGTQLDPAFFQPTNCCRKTVKDKLMGWLLTACILSGIGLLSAATLLALFIPRWEVFSRDPGPVIALLTICAVLIAIGIAFFIVYFIGKNKTWAKELKELDDQKASKE